MVRGAIEVAQPVRVAGWLHSTTEGLRDKTVLAFVGARCVGSGKVDVFRQDLLDAKLGDGYCGFDFPIRLGEGETVGAVIVRLQFSDLALIQAGSRVRGKDELAPAADLGAVPPAGVSWMMDRGMLEQAEYDFLRCILAAGAYERSLRAAKRGAAAAGAGRPDPEGIVREMLGLLALGEVKLVRTSLPGVCELAAQPALLRQAGGPVVALWSQDRGRVLIEERSHLGGRAGGGPIAAPAPGANEYSFGPDCLLFLHRGCRFAAQGPAPVSGVTVFSAAANDAAASPPAPASRVRAA